MPISSKVRATAPGSLMDDEAKGFDLTLITYKTISQTKTRTVGNYWLPCHRSGKLRGDLGR